MFSRGAFKPNSCRIAAFGALAIGAAMLSGAASAAPLQLFPFITVPSEPAAPPATQSAPSEDQNATAELPARLKRQIVSYSTSEAPGTIIIDTPNKFLYLIEDGGRALRYGIGVGRPGFLWAAVKT